jgi:hypothetical protein
MKSKSNAGGNESFSVDQREKATNKKSAKNKFDSFGEESLENERNESRGGNKQRNKYESSND